MTSLTPSKTRLLVCIALIVLVAGAYARVGHLGYTYFDDPDYVYSNAHVRAGLTWSGVEWALTTGCAANWHPLTWVSHMADSQLFGVNPGADHIVNAGFHALNAVLLFLLLSAMTGSIWRSAFVAAIFAVHPLQVESVAWISERKSVLSMLFWILTMWAYWRYRNKPGVGAYALVGGLLALGLMAKPMLVTLPIVLLLMDYWPLGKRGEGAATSMWRSALNKLPLLALSALSCWVTMIVQREGGTVRLLQDYPVGQRMANAAVACFSYLGKMVWPSGLCAMYPHPKNTLPAWTVALCVVGLVAITWAAFRARKSRPYLIVGWLWYLVTLTPVIGIVQVGPQGMADRYAYVPLIGIFIIIAWGAGDLLRMVPKLNPRYLAVVAGAMLAALVVCTYVQTGYWRDNDTLFKRAMDATGNHPTVRYCYASVLLKQGETDKAISCLQRSLADPQGREQIHFLLGSIFANQGRLDEAIAEDRAALRIDPNYALVQNNLGVALGRKGDNAEAIEHMRQAIRLRPRYSVAYHSLGVLLARQGKIDEAIAAWKRALEINPSMGDTHFKLAQALCQVGDYDGAWREVRAAQHNGCTVDAGFIAYLSGKMPPPR